MLFREHCCIHPTQGFLTKDLTRIGRRMEDIILVDNSPNSYYFQPENALPSLSWIDSRSDFELRDMVPFLQRLSQRDVKDVRTFLTLAIDHSVFPQIAPCFNKNKANFIVHQLGQPLFKSDTEEFLKKLRSDIRCRRFDGYTNSMFQGAGLAQNVGAEHGHVDEERKEPGKPEQVQPRGPQLTASHSEGVTPIGSKSLIPDHPAHEITFSNEYGSQPSNKNDVSNESSTAQQLAGPLDREQAKRDAYFNSFTRSDAQSQFKIKKQSFVT